MTIMERTPRIPAKMCSISVLLFTTLVASAAVNNAPLVHANDTSSKIALYVLENFSDPKSTFVTSFPGYNGTAAAQGFGATSVYDFDLRLSKDLDSPVVGQIVGQVLGLRGRGIYLDIAISLNTPSYSGYVTAQYLGETLVAGDGPITGGSGDFLGAKGYLRFDVVDASNPEAIALSLTLHLKYN